MTNSENFKQMVDHIFGKDVVDVKLCDANNNVIGGLNSPDNFENFKVNFEKRLVSLKQKYEKTSEYKKILDQIALIADDRNWEGAYAELVAYDILNLDDNISIEIDKTLPATESYAAEMGNEETNEDGYISCFDSYFDVKILSDTVKTLLNSIIQDAKNKVGLGKDCHIQPQYNIDDDNQDYQTNRRQLVNELADALSNLPKDAKQIVTSNIISGLSYKIQWGAGIITTESSYEPYRNAKNWHNFIFKRYTKKIMKNNRFYLVFVNFPWYNNLVNDVFGYNEIFYRALSRRVFMQNRHTGMLMNTIVPQYQGKETVYEVSQRITGLIFIDDFSIDKEGRYAAYIYLNPNAVNKFIHMEYYYLLNIANYGTKNKGIVDNFEYDNY